MECFLSTPGVDIDVNMRDKVTQLKIIGSVGYGSMGTEKRSGGLNSDVLLFSKVV